MSVDLAVADAYPGPMIETEDHAGLRILRIARPDKAGALTPDMLGALAQGVRTAPGTAIILTGTGKVFSAGADLDAARAGLATSPLWEELSGEIARFPGLTIAALNGTVAGGAMGMVLACDLRIAAQGAKLFYPVMRLGFLPQPSDPVRLRRLAGPGLAARILLAGEKVPVEDARGLIDVVLPVSEVMPRAREMCAAVEAAKPGHAAAIKDMLRL